MTIVLPIDTVELAKALLGWVLIRDGDGGRAAGRIVETEAYLPCDPACHAFIGKTARNATLFGPPHRAYVYRIYGTSFCFNLSSELEGRGAGVLVRSLEPVEGIELMQRRRGTLVLRDLCRGPGRLCQALAIGREFDGAELFGSPPLRLTEGEPPRSIGSSRRIGVTAAARRRLRFFEKGNPYLSGPAALNER
jgi:DNA-3-methyladenine glycosylase